MLLRSHQAHASNATPGVDCLIPTELSTPASNQHLPFEHDPATIVILPTNDSAAIVSQGEWREWLKGSNGDAYFRIRKVDHSTSPTPTPARFLNRAYRGTDPDVIRSAPVIRHPVPTLSWTNEPPERCCGQGKILLPGLGAPP